MTTIIILLSLTALVYGLYIRWQILIKEDPIADKLDEKLGGSWYWSDINFRYEDYLTDRAMTSEEAEKL